MNKELEAFKRIKNHTLSYTGDTYKNSTDSREKQVEDLDIIESALKEVSGEDRAFLKHIKNGKLHPLTTKCYQNLLKKEKALEIIKRNPVMIICEFYKCVIELKMSYEEYCDYFSKDERSIESKEEYDLLKEVLL